MKDVKKDIMKDKKMIKTKNTGNCKVFCVSRKRSKKKSSDKCNAFCVLHKRSS